MQDTVRLIQNCTVLSQKKNIKYTAALPDGEPLFFSLLVMTLYIVLNVITKWSFWNSITTTNAYPSKKCTRKSCPNLVESVPPHRTVMI